MILSVVRSVWQTGLTPVRYSARSAARPRAHPRARRDEL